MTLSDISRTPRTSLMDNHGRPITYLRLAITDRCNLRCRYCMPENGFRFGPHREILRYEEMLRLLRIFICLGIGKVRITGGEPFARRDCVSFLRQIKQTAPEIELHVTTNGVDVAPHLDTLLDIGVNGINLSLDTLDREQFRQLTGRDCLPMVLDTFHGALEKNIPLKINTVVLDETTDETILSLAGLAREHPVTVRFIEKMPFSGGNGIENGQNERLRQRMHGLLPLSTMENHQPSTALVHAVAGFRGMIGIIEGHSRKFCATCNKLRITPLGMLKTCLYDNGVLDLKAMLRGGAGDEAIRRAVTECAGRRFANGRETEARCHHCIEPSMASIGG